MRSIVIGTTLLNRHWRLHNVKCLQPIILATTVTHIPLWSMHNTCPLKSCFRKDVTFCCFWCSFVSQSVNFLLTLCEGKYGCAKLTVKTKIYYKQRYHWRICERTIFVDWNLLIVSFSIRWRSCRLAVTRWVSLVEQEQHTLPEHLSWLRVFSRVHVAQSLVFCVVFCRSLFDPFLWSMYCLVLLQIMASDYPIGIFKHSLKISQRNINDQM